MTCLIHRFHLIYFCLSITISGCNHKPSIQKQIVVKKIDLERKKIKHNTAIDSLKYDQHVLGKDEEGKNVYGHIRVEGNNGIGLLIDNKGKEIEVVFEMESLKTLVATDVEGFKYKLKID